MTHDKIMVDTNIVSYTMKGSKEAEIYAKHLNNRLISISFVTVGELYYGAEKANWSKAKRLIIEQNLKNFVVIPYDYLIAQKFGFVYAYRQKKGKRVSWPDAWIAACAIRHKVPLVTHNPKDFTDIPDLKVITELTNY